MPVAKNQKLAVIGSFAKIPRYQGAGSSKINPHHITSLCDALDARHISYTWAAGYEAENAEADETLIAQAVKVSEEADVIIACVGLPDSYESEGFDRAHLEMPEAQNVLIDALIATGKPVVALVSTGAVIHMPWQDKVDSILLLYLAGQNGGTAAAQLLLGEAVPCGKLAETWPKSLNDCPCGDNFGHGGNVEYRESIYVGYRYYDKAQKEVAYPFGFGLSYTSFQYSDLKLSKEVCTDSDIVNVTCNITNTGAYAGAEVVQLYVVPPESSAFKPVRELRDYQKVFLHTGESKTLTFQLNRRAFAYYNVNISDWFVESGEYRIELGSSSRDIRLFATLTIHSAQNGEIPDYRNTAKEYYDLTGGSQFSKESFASLIETPITPWRSVRPFTRNSTLGELRTCPMGETVVNQVIQGMQAALGGSGDLAVMLMAMVEDMPLRQLGMMAGDQFSNEKVEELLTMLNAQS